MTAIILKWPKLFLLPATRRRQKAICEAAFRIAEIADTHRDSPHLHSVVHTFAEREIEKLVERSRQ